MLDTLARLLGLSRTDAEASLYSERAARHVLTRRSAIGLAGAMCAGTVLGDAPSMVFTLPPLTPFQRELIRQLDEKYAKMGNQMAVTVFAPRLSGMSYALANSVYRDRVKVMR